MLFKPLLLLFRRFFFLCLLSYSAAVLASPGSVVFNSFKDRSLALKESIQISRQFGIAVRIEKASVNGSSYHRVLSPVTDEASARELIRRAKMNGLTDVWWLSSKQTPAIKIQNQL